MQKIIVRSNGNHLATTLSYEISFVIKIGKTDAEQFDAQDFLVRWPGIVIRCVGGCSNENAGAATTIDTRINDREEFVARACSCGQSKPSRTSCCGSSPR